MWWVCAQPQILEVFVTRFWCWSSLLFRCINHSRVSRWWVWAGRKWLERFCRGSLLRSKWLNPRAWRQLEGRRTCWIECRTIQLSRFRCGASIHLIFSWWISSIELKCSQRCDNTARSSPGWMCKGCRLAHSLGECLSSIPKPYICRASSEVFQLGRSSLAHSWYQAYSNETPLVFPGGRW